MPLSRRWTLTRYLIEERRRFPDASGQLNALLLDVSLACKAIARIVAFGELVTTIEQSAAYIDGWRKKLKDDKKLVVQAAGQGQRAADHIRGVKFDAAEMSEGEPAVEPN